MIIDGTIDYLICDNCNKKFYVKNNKKKRQESKKHFCSMDCMGEYKTKHPDHWIARFTRMKMKYKNGKELCPTCEKQLLGYDGLRKCYCKFCGQMIER